MTVWPTIIPPTSNTRRRVGLEKKFRKGRQSYNRQGRKAPNRTRTSTLAVGGSTRSAWRSSMVINRNDGTRDSCWWSIGKARKLPAMVQQEMMTWIAAGQREAELPPANWPSSIQTKQRPSCRTFSYRSYIGKAMNLDQAGTVRVRLPVASGSS